MFINMIGLRSPTPELKRVQDLQLHVFALILSKKLVISIWKLWRCITALSSTDWEAMRQKPLKLIKRKVCFKKGERC